MADGKSVRAQKEEARLAARRKARGAARGKPKKGITSVVGMSVATSAAGTVFLVIVVRAVMFMGFNVDPDLQTLISLLGFIIIFLTSLLIFMHKYMDLDLFGSDEDERDWDNLSSPDGQWGGVLNEPKQRFEKVFADAEQKKPKAPATLDDAEDFTDAPELAPPPPDEEASDLSDDESGDSSDDDDTGSGQGEDKLSEETMTKVFGHLKPVIVDVTKVLQSRPGKLNKFMKFGLNLFFAGVCARLKKHSKLSSKEGRGVLARLMELTGSDAQQARSFSDNINEYGDHPLYREMINAGDTYMERHLDDDKYSEEPVDLSAVLDEWATKEGAVSLPETHIFMFTDIMDAANLSDELGDDMKDIVNLHDDAVRDALQKFNGEEIKHLGHGIMAVFDDARQAVDAALDMQREINLHSRHDAATAFDVRVGMHHGEAIREQNNFSGPVVKTAALVCAEAGAEQIWVSEAVYQACPAYQPNMKNHGGFTLKGVSGEVTLFEMLWEPLPDDVKPGKVGYGEIGKR